MASGPSWASRRLGSAVAMVGYTEKVVVMPR